MHRAEAVLGHLQPFGSNELVASQPTIQIATPSTPYDPSLDIERKKATFDVKKLYTVLSGGRKMAELKEKVVAELAADPVFASCKDDTGRPWAEQRALTMARIKRLMEYNKVDDPVTFGMRQLVVAMMDDAAATRQFVHYGLFAGAVRGSGTPEQVKLFSETIIDSGFACFAMTEIGHGSYIQGMETTATLDMATDEFVVHSPTITSTKCWIAGAACTATDAAVYARVIVKGKDYGVHPIIVHLRRKSDFAFYPGVQAGDCGAKIGRNGIDNGWIRFDRVRVPRGNLLMRHFQVTADGTVTEPARVQLSYGALLVGRVNLVRASAFTLSKALTIAVRYSAVRRQFPSSDPSSGHAEEKILDYATHMHRLMPVMAEGFAYLFTAQTISMRLATLQAALKQGKTDGLNELHALSAGLKAFCTWNTLQAIEQCRMCCGGHGYSAYSQFGRLYTDEAVNPIWEGDNTVMALQTARALIKDWQAVNAGKPAKAARYLNDHATLASAKCAAKSKDEMRKPEVYNQAFGFIAVHQVAHAAQRLQERMAKLSSSPAPSRVEHAPANTSASTGTSEDDEETVDHSFLQAWNQSGVELIDASRAHVYAFMAGVFSQSVTFVGSQDASVGAILRTCSELFAAVHLQERLDVLLAHGHLDAKQAIWVKELVVDICQELRPQAVPLVDAFGVPDELLPSAIGKKDGQVYVNLFEAFSRSDHAMPDGKPSFWDSTLKPFLSQPRPPIKALGT